MKKFIENISLREQHIGYELFNKKRLYEICGSYENYKSNKTPFCPRKLRLFLTSEFCDLSKVIPRKEDLKFIMNVVVFFKLLYFCNTIIPFIYCNNCVN